MNVSSPVRDGALATPMPRSPQTIVETGLPAGFLLDHLIKTIFRQGMERPSTMAAAVKLSTLVVHELIEIAKDKQLLNLLGQPGANMAAEMRYQLTEQGRNWALSALEQNGWVGPAPVPIEQFCAQVHAQTVKTQKLTEASLKRVFQELTLPEDLMHKIGPAVNSGASILLFGPPGNGKSSIATAVCSAFDNLVFLPHALAIGTEIVVFYDSAVHRRVELAEDRQSGLRRPITLDARYVPCQRPAVITGGELTIEKFDLVRNPATRLYDAPLQMKAAGGLFVVDDFGRQRHKPQELINRLIIPLESGTDHLVLESGRKIEVPFDTLVIFATNFEPRSLMDEAGLRRLRHKILIDRPDRKTFVKILVRTAAKAGLVIDEDVLAYILFDLYGQQHHARFNAFHPRFLIDQCVNICAYQGIPAQLSKEVLDQAWGNLIAAH